MYFTMYDEPQFKNLMKYDLIMQGTGCTGWTGTKKPPYNSSCKSVTPNFIEIRYAIC
jgi:hypothetical protein